ncbi:hypothetical protein EYF80_007697 [Liparis tanakae]|uniref:Uncharacterized protein n=1 Tax=Liparis tanakae TaxID=230148 RepID=A0A4Z2IW46_9TELE|nr:hypothetical protein EYF80_007697 [Liparis tanakae]
MSNKTESVYKSNSWHSKRPRVAATSAGHLKNIGFKVAPRFTNTRKYINAEKQRHYGSDTYCQEAQGLQRCLWRQHNKARHTALGPS